MTSNADSAANSLLPAILDLSATCVNHADGLSSRAVRQDTLLPPAIRDSLRSGGLQHAEGRRYEVRS